MFDMRFKLPEMLRERGIDTAYALTKLSKEKEARIPISTAQRLFDAGDRPKRVDLDTLEALCTTLDVDDPGEFLELDRTKKRKK